ncbi:hypothetical protein L9F63_012564, partial [Diploptera punctata]
PSSDITPSSGSEPCSSDTGSSASDVTVSSITSGISSSTKSAPSENSQDFFTVKSSNSTSSRFFPPYVLSCFVPISLDSRFSASSRTSEDSSCSQTKSNAYILNRMKTQNEYYWHRSCITGILLF